jgi:type IV pilus assembly protein PilB
VHAAAQPAGRTPEPWLGPDLSDRIREMILQRKPGSDIKRAAKEEGMTFLREAALAKVFAGKTSLHEINKVTFVE